MSIEKLLEEAFEAGRNYESGSFECSDEYCIFSVDDKDNSAPNFDNWMKIVDFRLFITNI